MWVLYGGGVFIVVFGMMGLFFVCMFFDLVVFKVYCVFFLFGFSVFIVMIFICDGYGFGFLMGVFLGVVLIFL